MELLRENLDLRQLLPTASTALRQVMLPMPTPRFLGFILLSVIAATIYCQIWCLIAFPPTHRMPMPIEASLAWSSSVIVPWIFCFEISKRKDQIARPASAKGLVLIGAFLFAAFLSIVLELGLDRLIGVESTRSLSIQLASQLPIALLTTGLLTIGAVIRTPASSETTPGNALAQLLTRSGEIEWIRAAGNYVEVHGGGRVTLHRVTMAKLEHLLNSTRFARIHRSMIVNRDSIASRVSIDGVPGLRMRDGTLLKIGDRYARRFHAEAV